MGFKKCTVIIDPTLQYHIEYSHHPNAVIHLFQPSFPQTLVNTDLFTISTVLSFRDCHVTEIIICSLFRMASFLTYSNTHLRFIYAFVWIKSSFLPITKWYFIVLLYHSLSILTTEEYLCCFQFGASTI